jgi:hypothetical protein
MKKTLWPFLLLFSACNLLPQPVIETDDFIRPKASISPTLASNSHPGLLGKSEKDVSAKRESYVYKMALPNADFSKLLYAYDTTEEVDFKDSKGLAARRTWYSGLWLFDRATGKNERLPAALQFTSDRYLANPLIWVDHDRVIALDSSTDASVQVRTTLYIVDLAQKTKEIVSTRLIDQYFVQGEYLYYLAASKIYQYHLPTGSTTPMPLPPAIPDYSSNTFTIYPYQGEQILIKKLKLFNQKGKYDFSIQLSPRVSDPTPPWQDYYLYNTNTFKASLLPGAADISIGNYDDQRALFSPNFQHFALLNQIHEGKKVLPFQVKGTPYLWITDQLLLSVDLIQEVPGGPANVIHKIYLLDVATGQTRLETAMPKSCITLYKAQYNQILAQCGGGQVYHLKGTPEQPGQFEALFTPPTYAYLGTGSQTSFSEQAPIFVVKQGENHYADIVGLSPNGELISKFKLLPPEKPDFVFDLTKTPEQADGTWKPVYDNYQR